MKKIIAILVVIATVTAAVSAASDDRSKVADLNTVEQAADTELILEEWMLTPAYESVELEAEPDLENWMMDTDGGIDESLELENWMLKESEISGTDEKDPELENWMFIFS